MLVLTRKSNQSIMIGDEIEVSVLAIMGEKVRIGIQAPRTIPVFRKEVYLEIQQERGEDPTAKQAVDEALDEIAPGAVIVATGNALRSSPVWLQIIADVLGRPVMFGGTPEASIRGAALLALEALGTIVNLEAVSVSVDEVFEPDMRRHARYREGLARQQELYERLFGSSEFSL